MSKPFNKLNFSLPFGMDTAVPVDYNSFFTSYSEASAAASTAVSAGSNESIYYIGQQLYVVDDAEKTVKTYLISHDRTLTDIGKVYSFTSGLSSEYLSSADTWNVGIDTTNIVAPSSASEYLKFADAKRVKEELNAKLDSSSSYPDWSSKEFDAWTRGEICSWNGKLYICTDDEHLIGQFDKTPDISEYWSIKPLKDIISDTEEKFSDYLPLSGGTMSGRLTLSGNGDNANFLQILDDGINVRYGASGMTIAGDDYIYAVSLPVTSGTIALTSQYLSGYGITDAYTKSETISAIDGNGRYPIIDMTPADGNYSGLPLESFATEIVSSNGDNITFVHKELNTFNQLSDYFPGTLEWYHGGIYKCIRRHKGEWDENDFVRVMRDMWISIDCTGIDTNINVTWPSNIDVFNSALSSDIAPVSGECNVYHITEYANDHFAITRCGGGVSYGKIEELSLMMAINAETAAATTLQSITNYNMIMDLQKELHQTA